MKTRLKKLLCSLLCITLIGTMIPVIPGAGGTVYGAADLTTSLSINDQPSDGTTSVYSDLSQDIDRLDSGGWKWDAATGTLILKGFDGAFIGAEGGLRLRLEGDNKITSSGQCIAVKSGAITIDKTTDDKSDNLMLKSMLNTTTSGSKSGTIYAESGTVINGGHIDASYVVDVDQPTDSTKSAAAYGINGDVALYQGAILTIKVRSNQSLSSTCGIYGALRTYGSGDAVIDVDTAYKGGTTGRMVGVDAFYASNLCTSHVIIDVVNNGNDVKTEAIEILEGVHFDAGGRLEIKNGSVRAQSGSIESYEGIVASNIVVTPSEYIFDLPGKISAYGYLCDAEDNILYSDITFVGVAEDQKLNFVESPAWNIKKRKIRNSFTGYLAGGLGGKYTSDMKFVITEGQLPQGLSLKEQGYITGSPQEFCGPGSVEISIYRNDMLLETFTLHYEGVYGDSLTINDVKYDVAKSVSGEGWTYNSSKELLVLEGFQGNYIGYDGDLNLVLKGENVIVPTGKEKPYGLCVDGDLYCGNSAGYTTDGSLTIRQESVEGEPFYGMYVNGISTLSYGDINIDITGKADTVGIFAQSGIRIRDKANLTVSVVSTEGASTGIDSAVNLYGDGDVKVSAAGSKSVTGVKELYTNSTYSGTASIQADREGGNGIAIKQLRGLNAVVGGEVSVTKGIVCLFSADSEPFAYNIKITPEPLYIAQKALPYAPETEVYAFADEKGDFIDGGFSFQGEDVQMEEPVKFTFDETWVLPEMTMNKKIDRILLQGGVTVEDYSVVTFEIIDGAFPEGITMTGSGTISGSPTKICDAGSVTIRLLDDGVPINYIEPFQISYGAVYAADVKMTIDGVEHSRKQNVSGSGWNYDAQNGILLLDGYKGGPIESEKRLVVQLKGENIITIDGTGTKTAGIHIDYDPLIIEKTNSDTGDKLLIQNAGEGEKQLCGVKTGDLVELNGGTVEVRLHTTTCAAEGFCYGERIRVNNDANLFVDVRSEKGTAAGVHRLHLYGNGTTEVVSAGSTVRNTDSFAVDEINFFKDSQAKVLIDAVCLDAEGTERPGIGVRYFQGLDFAGEGSLKVLRGSVDLSREVLGDYVKVTPEQYYCGTYITSGGNTVWGMFGPTGELIATDISIVPVTEKQPLRFVPKPEWKLDAKTVSDYNGISFEDGFGGRENYREAVCEILRGQLPKGLALEASSFRISGYHTESCEAGSVVVGMFHEGNLLQEFELPYGKVVDLEEEKIPEITFYTEEYEVVCGESFYPAYNIKNFNHLGMDEIWTASDPEKVEIIEYLPKIKGCMPGVVTITLSVNLSGVIPKTCTVYVREKTPKAYFKDGKICGLEPNGTYTVNGEAQNADENGCIHVAHNWSGTRVRLIHTNPEPRCNSDVQTLYVLSDENVTFSNPNTFMYSGNSVEPEVVVTVDDNQLVEDVDYDVSFTNNVNAGTAEVIITGKGTYAGVVKKPFTIEPVPITSLHLSSALYHYNGEVKTPKVTVTAGAEKVVLEGKQRGNSNVEVLYSPGRKKPGTYRVTVTGKGNYTGEISKIFKVKVKNTAIKSLKAGSASFTCKWITLPSRYISGYQIRYSRNADMKNATKSKLQARGSKGKTFRNLKVKQKYYVQIRTYKKIDGKYYYSNWSKVRTVKTKA